MYHLLSSTKDPLVIFPPYKLRASCCFSSNIALSSFCRIKDLLFRNVSPKLRFPESRPSKLQCHVQRPRTQTRLMVYAIAPSASRRISPPAPYAARAATTVERAIARTRHLFSLVDNEPHCVAIVLYFLSMACDRKICFIQIFTFRV